MLPSFYLNQRQNTFAAALCIDPYQPPEPESSDQSSLYQRALRATAPTFLHIPQLKECGLHNVI